MYVRCVQKIALLIFPAPSFYVRTYILWSTAGTTGKTVVNLRSRNTKQTQMMRVTQQQQHSTAKKSSKAAAVVA